MNRLAIVSSHPIQYNAPLFKLLTERGNINIKVFYTWGKGALVNKQDPGFPDLPRLGVVPQLLSRLSHQGDDPLEPQGLTFGQALHKSGASAFHEAFNLRVGAVDGALQPGHGLFAAVVVSQHLDSRLAGSELQVACAGSWSGTTHGRALRTYSHNAGLASRFLIVVQPVPREVHQAIMPLRMGVELAQDLTGLSAAVRPAHDDASPKLRALQVG